MFLNWIKSEKKIGKEKEEMSILNICNFLKENNNVGKKIRRLIKINNEETELLNVCCKNDAGIKDEYIFCIRYKILNKINKNDKLIKKKIVKEFGRNEKKYKARLRDKFDSKTYQLKLIKFSINETKKNEFKIDSSAEAWDFLLERAKISFNSRLNSLKMSNVSFKDFKFISSLGKGSYGNVMLAIKTDSEEFFAVKIINKVKLIKSEHIPHAKQEKQISSSIRFPFLVFMHYFYQTEWNIFFVLQLVLGKNLFEVASKGKMNEDIAKFFGAQILLGLEYLHFLDIIFRDLKLENIIMDQTGYIKITDFGFAKVLKGRTYTICGTPEYMAPEIFTHKGYGLSVDWWAYGVLIYELCAGNTPFTHDVISIIFAKIQKGHYKKPDYFSKDLKDLLDNLLVSDVTKRFGYINLGIERIKQHKWYSTISWVEIFNKNVKAPISCGVPQMVTNLYPVEFKEQPPKQPIAEKYKKMFNEF